jgi:GntR family transcriptional regulator
MSFCPNLEEKDLEGAQLCDILESDYQHEIVKIVETLESTTATASEGNLLQAKESAPLLLLEDIIFTKGDVPMEYSRVLFRGDKIKLKLEFNKTV